VANSYWSGWYSGWGWFLWFGIMILMFSSAGNWGYSYRIHRSHGREPGKNAFEILSERYARGDITREEFGQMSVTINQALERNRTSTPPHT
jgi:putative membrane protein